MPQYEVGLLTVIVLSYNNVKYVTQTISSILKSEYKNLEVICVDDGSDEQIFLELSMFCEETEVKVVRNLNNLGIPASCNVGLAHSRGEFISVIGDDIVLPTRYLNDVEILKRYQEVGFVSSGVNLIDSDGNRIPELEDKRSIRNPGIVRETPEDVWLRGSHALTPTLTFRRSVLNKFGPWNETYEYEDKPLLIKLAKHQIQGYLRDEKETLYRRHVGNISSKLSDRFFQDELRLIEDFGLRVSKPERIIKIFLSSHYALLHLGVPEQQLWRSLKLVNLHWQRSMLFSFPVRLAIWFASLAFSRGFSGRKTKQYLFGSELI